MIPHVLAPGFVLVDSGIEVFADLLLERLEILEQLAGLVVFIVIIILLRVRMGRLLPPLANSPFRDIIPQVFTRLTGCPQGENSGRDEPDAGTFEIGEGRGPEVRLAL